MNKNKTIELLRHAARRASQHPFFLAAALERFRIHSGMQEADLAQFLGCDPESLPRVALCRQPDPASPAFRSDIRRIADTFGLQPERLLQVIRETDVLNAIGEASHVAEEHSARGFLMAASDLEAEEAEVEETADEGGRGKEEQT